MEIIGICSYCKQNIDFKENRKLILEYKKIYESKITKKEVSFII